MESSTKLQKIKSQDWRKDCKIAENALNEAKEAVLARENPSKIKKALSILKDVSLRVSSSLIATGILALLKQIGV